MRGGEGRGRERKGEERRGKERKGEERRRRELEPLFVLSTTLCCLIPGKAWVDLSVGGMKRGKGRKEGS